MLALCDGPHGEAPIPANRPALEWWIPGFAPGAIAGNRPNRVVRSGLPAAGQDQSCDRGAIAPERSDRHDQFPSFLPSTHGKGQAMQRLAFPLPMKFRKVIHKTPIAGRGCQRSRFRLLCQLANPAPGWIRRIRHRLQVTRHIPRRAQPHQILVTRRCLLRRLCTGIAAIEERQAHRRHKQQDDHSASQTLPQRSWIIQFDNIRIACACSAHQTPFFAIDA